MSTPTQRSRNSVGLHEMRSTVADWLTPSVDNPDELVGPPVDAIICQCGWWTACDTPQEATDVLADHLADCPTSLTGTLKAYWMPAGSHHCWPDTYLDLGISRG